MPASNTPTTSPSIEPVAVTWYPEFIQTDGMPTTVNPNPGPGGLGALDPAYRTPAYAQPQGATSRTITPVPGTVYGDVAQATMTQATMGAPLPCYPPEVETYEFPVFYPGVGWVSSANAPNTVAGT
jgi:hypothetical protein